MTLSCAPVRNGARLPKGGRFLPGTSRRVLYRMIKRPSPGKARDILVACCKRKGGNGIWSIARELMRPYSTVRGWLVRMMRRGLGGRFDQKYTGRKKILGPQTLKKIMGWTRWDPSRYGFEPASWHLDMVTRCSGGRPAGTPDPVRCGESCAASAFRTPSLGRCRARPPLQRSRTCSRKG